MNSPQRGILRAIIIRLNPKAAEDSPQALLAAMEIVPIVFTLPFALIGLIWLISVTDIAVLRANIVPLLVVLAAAIIMEQYLFTILVETEKQQLMPINSSLSSVVVGGAALTFGASVLWIPVIIVLIGAVRTIASPSRAVQSHWLRLSIFAQTIASYVFGELVLLWVYRQMGGMLPFRGDSVQVWTAALIAQAVNLIVIGTIFLTIVHHINQLIGGVGQSAKSTLISVIGLSAVTAPFSLLIPLVYSLGGLVVFMLLVLEFIFMNQLAHALSRAAEASQQRARELQHLESLSEAILQAPPDVGEIEALLRDHAGGMFPRDRLEIRLFEDDSGKLRIPVMRLDFPPDDPVVAEAAWAGLLKASDSQIELASDQIAGNSGKHAALMVKVISVGSSAGKLLGGIALVRHHTVGRSSDSLASLQSLASQIASALYRIETHTESLERARLAQELEVAGRIQSSFLPRTTPTLEGWEIAASLIPARQTSGDFYDFIPLPEGRLGIVVADVADKGTGAALYMALSRTLLRSYALDFPHDPASALRAANERILADTASDQFVTLFYAILNPNSGAVTYANAGHNPAFVINPDNADPISLKHTGVPLGMFTGMTWRSETLTLEARQSLLMYTDGVSEAQNAQHEEFGEDRLISATRASAGVAQSMKQAVLSAVESFVGDSPQFDDMTLVIAARCS